MHGCFRRLRMLHAAFTTFWKMNEKILQHQSLTALRKFPENFRCVLLKICAFSMQYTKLFVIFRYQFLKNFVFQKKISREFSSVFLQNFPCNLENFPRTLFIITCSQNLSCVIIYSFHGLFIMTSRNVYVKKWRFKKFSTKFSRVHWNFDEKITNQLSKRKKY